MSTRDERIAIVLKVIDDRFGSSMPDWWPNTDEWAEAIVDALDAAEGQKP
jgi:hypothetical protein